MIIFFQQDYLHMWLLTFTTAYLKNKTKKRLQGILVIVENSESYCPHYLTEEETVLHIALPCASIILTLGINERVNGLLKSFNLCHCELRRSNGFCCSKCQDKAFLFSQSEESNYNLISLNGSSGPIFQNIWWEYFWHSLHDSHCMVAWKYMPQAEDAFLFFYS